jgi:hypothetical protein
MRLLRPLDVWKLNEGQEFLAVGALGLCAAMSVNPAFKNLCDRCIEPVNLALDLSRRRLGSGEAIPVKAGQVGCSFWRWNWRD